MLANRCSPKTIRRVAAYLLPTVLLGCMTSTLVVCSRQCSISLDDIEGIHLCWAALCYGLFCIANAWGWSLIMAVWGYGIPHGDAIPLWIRCEALRWLPGSVWNFGARSVEAHKRGVPRLIGAASMVFELIYSIIGRLLIVVSACAIAADGLQGIAHEIPLTTVIVFALGIALSVMGVMWMAQRRHLKARQHLHWRQLLNVLTVSRGQCCQWFILQGYYLAISLLHGCALVQIVHSVHPYSRAPFWSLVAVNAAAWLVGFFAIFAPGGLVVREAFLATVLTCWFSPAEAIAMAVIWRMLQIVIEAVMLLGALALCKGRASSPPHRPKDASLASTYQH